MLKSRPDSVDALAGLAGILHKKGNVQGAYELYQKACLFAPKEVDYKICKAACLRETGKLEASMLVLQEALKHDDDNPVIYSNIGLSYRKLNDYSSATKAYSIEISLSPQNISAFNRRAFCYVKLNDFENALDDYSRAISIDTSNIHAHYNKAICHQKLGQIKSAIEYFTKAIELEPLNPQAFLNRAACFRQIGRIDNAVTDYCRATELQNRSGS